MSKDFYLEEAEKINRELKRLIFHESGWELKKNYGQCQVHCLPSPTHDQAFVWKGETTITMLPETLIDMVHPTEKYRFMWDPNVASCTILEELTRVKCLNVFIAHTVAKSQFFGLLSARDTIDAFKLEETDQYISSQFGSVEYENEPSSTQKCVRAWSYPSGIFFFKNGNDENENETSTRVIVIFQADARLDILPPAMLNSAMPTFIKGYFDALRKSSYIQWTPLIDVPGRRKIE